MPIRYSRADTEVDGPDADARRQRLRSLGITEVVAYRNGSTTVHQVEFRKFVATHGPDFWRRIDVLAAALADDNNVPFDEVRADLRTEVDLARRAANPDRYEEREEQRDLRALARQEQAAAEQQRAVEEWKAQMRTKRRAERTAVKSARLAADAERMRRETADLRQRAARAAEKVSSP